jgi:hypothetical protein
MGRVMAQHDKRCKCDLCVEPHHARSHSTPPALNCDRCARGLPCNYTHGRSPYVTAPRPLEIDSRPECRVCHEPYEPGDGLDGVCRPCRVKDMPSTILADLRSWL